MDLAHLAAEEGASEPLTADMLPGVLRALDDALGHIPYAITGTAALTLWGYDDGVPTHVDIVCPAESKDIIKSWTRASGGLISTEPGQLGIRTDDGLLRKIKVRYIERGFDRLTLESIPIPAVPTPRRPDSLPSNSPTRVVQSLSLPCLLDQLALDYCANYTAPGGFRRRCELAKAIFWILECIRDGGEGMEKLSQENVPTVVKPEFWDRFHNLYPKGKVAFQEAGLPVLGGRPLLSACPPIVHGEEYDTPGPWNGPVYAHDSSSVATFTATDERGVSAAEDAPRTEQIAASRPWSGPSHANASIADTTFTALIQAARDAEADEYPPEAAATSRRGHRRNIPAPLQTELPFVQDEDEEFRPLSPWPEPKKPWWRRLGVDRERRSRDRGRERRHDSSRRSPSRDPYLSRTPVDGGKFANLFNDNMD